MMYIYLNHFDTGAAIQAHSAGYTVLPEIMVPLVSRYIVI